MRTRLVLITLTSMIAVSAVMLLLAIGSAHAAQVSASFTWTDDFNGPSLDSRWSWVREDASRWSLTAQPGFLRLTTNQATSAADNILLQTAPAGDYEISTRVFFTPTQDYQFAGLMIYQDDSNYLQLGRAFCNAPSICVGNGIYFDRVEGGSFIGSNFATTTTVSNEAYLQVVRHGNVYTGSVSSNGIAWTVVGVHTVTISPTRIGLVATNKAESDMEISADFDFFTLIDSSFRLYLPFVRK
jgi:beta-xylosidase